MFSPVDNPPVVDVGMLMTYMEVMVVGNVPFPEGVSYIVLFFSPLFGTARGRTVVEWAVLMGIGVAWSPGQVDMSTPCGTPSGSSDPQDDAHRAKQTTSTRACAESEERGGRRYPLPSSSQVFLDPTVAFVRNATANRTAFDNAWDRIGNTSAGQPPSWWTAQWDDVYNLVGGGMHVHNLLPGLCADVDACFGVDDRLRCLCAKA